MLLSVAQVLFKMLNAGVFNSINGCISTGKEANVYHATTAAGSHLAVKARGGVAMCGARPAGCVSGSHRARLRCHRCTRRPSSCSKTATAT